MWKLLLSLFVIGCYISFRDTDNIEFIPSKTSIMDNFECCDVNTINYWTPLKYNIKTLANITIRVISKNTIDYKLENNYSYHINLYDSCHNIKGVCSVLTINDNDFDIMIRRKYEYTSIIKYLLYISSKEDEYNYLVY